MWSTPGTPNYKNFALEIMKTKSKTGGVLDNSNI
jgi:hypothetical protein